MGTKDKKSISWFAGKWYIREDFNEEPFEGRPGWFGWDFMNYLREIGNCFNTREEAREMANRMRLILFKNIKHDDGND